ncbi:Retrovirus-related Pol polyprotein from transposon RE1 [Vitis vinifera]|uniref:Retrovirus-related Pol polyprotein from transposon RE1 n=1 Tax=Vitis vinifera TaxID=29760 RepID=A0A438D8R6_VITVI|nr:Retrovirus-related Pol polyprotein from transposon RE1 [Vitis vinifera]
MDSAPLCVKFTGTNYSTWAFQFELFLKGKDLWGHIDGTDVEKPSTFDKSQDVGTSHSWAVLDARIMSWLLVQWSLILSPLAAPSLRSIYDYYSAFLTLWHEYADLVTADVPIVALSTIQTIHATTRRDQFLMKLRPEYESVHSSLLNRSPVPSLDICLVSYFAKSNALVLKLFWSNLMACFCCKEYGHIAATCPKEVLFLLQEERSHYQRMSYSPQNRQAQAFQTSVIVPPVATHDSPSAACSVPAPPALDYCTQKCSLPIAAIGDASSKFTDVFLAPQLSTNLISVGQLVDNNCAINFSDLSMVWHRRLGHPNTQILSHVLNSDLPGNKDRYSLSLECDSCKLGKSKTLPFPLHASRASHCFDLIHSDVLGTFPDSGGEYLSTEFQAFLASKGIIHQRSCPSTPQQNGVAERKNRHLLDVFSLSTRYCVYETLRPQSLSVAHPISDPTTLQMQSVAAPSVRRSSRVSVPPNRYGFPSSSSGNSISALTAALSKFDIPTCYSHAAKHDCWRQAMQEEIAALEANHTWDIEPCPPTIVPLGCKWVYSVKVRSDGSLDRYKARLVALGNNQEYGVNYEETFAPVAKMTTVRTILALAASSDWPLHQMDVKNAFLHGDLKECIYMKPPPGLFPFPTSHVYMGIVVLLVYVDDIVITGSDSALLGQLKTHLSESFHMKDLGPLTYFLGLEVHHSPSGISLNQHKYASDLVATAGLQGATSVDTPMELNVKLRKEEGDLLADPSLYRKLVGSLVYLTITRPDISFAVQQVSQFLQTPRHLHLAAVRRIIRYVQGTSTRGLFFPAGNSTRLAAYSDADWAGCADTRRSITGWCVFLGDVLISWKSKKQDRVSKSSTESEYRAMSLACSEIIWLRGLLAELDFSETDPTPLHADNTSAIQITANPVYHERTKHIEVDCHSIREAFEARVITLTHISTDLQIADIFTKALPRHRHCLLSSKLMLVDQPASI